MRNSVKCPNCSFENSNYEYICRNCKSFIRDRVYNLDLWSLTGALIENPRKAFQQIVYSEHKNFIFCILILVAAKLLVNIRFISVYSIGDFNPVTGIYLSYLIVLIVFTLLIVLYAYGFTRGYKVFKINTRFRDNLAVLIYSFLPFTFGIIFIFVIELIVFGRHLFSNNPSPFIINESIAYFFAGSEIFIMLWSIFLMFIAFRFQTNSSLHSIINTILFFTLLALLSFYSSKLIFTLSIF